MNRDDCSVLFWAALFTCGTGLIAFGCSGGNWFTTCIWVGLGLMVWTFLFGCAAAKEAREKRAEKNQAEDLGANNHCEVSMSVAEELVRMKTTRTVALIWCFCGGLIAGHGLVHDNAILAAIGGLVAGIANVLAWQNGPAQQRALTAKNANSVTAKT